MYKNIPVTYLWHIIYTLKYYFLAHIIFLIPSCKQSLLGVLRNHPVCLSVYIFVSAIPHQPILMNLYTVVVYNPRIRVKGAKSCAKRIKGDNYLYRTEWKWGFPFVIWHTVLLLFVLIFIVCFYLCLLQLYLNLRQ